MAVKKVDVERRDRIDAQAELVAGLIGEADPERVATYGSYGVMLTPDQLDKLLALASLPERDVRRIFQALATEYDRLARLRSDQCDAATLQHARELRDRFAKMCP